MALAFLVLMLIQSAFHPIKEIPLAGAEFSKEFKGGAIENWIDRDAQMALENQVKSSFGFRSALVRFMNQLRLTFLEEHNPYVVFGKDGYYFEEGYRSSVCGLDYLGEEAINAKIDSLDDFRNRLLLDGKKLIILIPPNKWRTYQKKVDWKCKPKMTNYESFIEKLSHRGYSICDEIDLFQYEHSQRPPHPLHSKQGTHWSIFGAAMSADHLWMTFAQEGVSLPKFSIESEEVDSVPRNTDKDLHDLLNIMAPPKSENLAYPTFSFSEGYKPRVTVIGDSYYQSYYYLGLHQGLFSMDSKYFYYNKSMYTDSLDQKEVLSDAIRKEEIAASDAVLLVISEPSLKWFGYGIFELYSD
ncbi:hypothetical protein N9545_01565 [Salibacteraceae bacterium]|nr:hypothetical protein [Salibacteraceae bacterium]MDB9710289.1 hypothetical protein [Salibacteraceae bacterium]